jgi:hypothetical protein
VENGHVHTGVIAVAFAGVSAIIVINLVRLAAARLTASGNPTISSVGASVGALVHWG